MPVDDALSAILSGAEALPEEMVALDAAYHRTLARDVAALRTQPPQAKIGRASCRERVLVAV